MYADPIEDLLVRLATSADVVRRVFVAGRDGGPPPIEAAMTLARLDAATHLERDPSLHGSVEALATPGSSYRAVAAHRLAHALWTASARPEEPGEALRTAALALAFQARRDTGVDIHPGARLGAGFVVDHGYGTVIGETVETGPRCYVLNGVTLGARGIADNPKGRRHPKLGAGVEIASFACVLGPITVGDDVFIGPHCIVRADLPARARVTLRHEVQVERSASTTPRRSAASRSAGLALVGDGT